MQPRRTMQQSWQRLALLLGLLCATFCGAAAQEAPVYRNARAPVEQRVADLLSRMTLEEKVAQLEGTWQNPGFARDASQRIVDDKGAFVAEHAAVLLKYGLGEMSRPSEKRGPREMAEFTNTMQKWLKENTRLGIPILFHEECLHGHAALGGTSFPQAIALASTWDQALLQDIFSSVAVEVRARGAQQCLAPVLDLARDPRWGRTEETYGEDPYLVAQMGIAYVTGMQGADLAQGIVATGKHFVGYGASEGGMN